MKHRIILIVLILIACSAPLWANTISFSYYNRYVVINTKTTPEEVVKDSYLAGVYDAYVACDGKWPLWKIHDYIMAKKFGETIYSAELKQKTAYYQGFYEFMYGYSVGTMGEFRDVFPQYRELFKAGKSYESAVRLVELGKCVFYLRNVAGESSFRTSDIN